MFIREKPKPIPQEILKLLNELQSLRQRRLLVIINPRYLNKALAKELQKLKEELKVVEKLDILVESWGGDINAAYQIMQFIRGLCPQVTTLACNYAKSAATFLCLCGDELIMSRRAELGPLDAQIPDPRNPKDLMSALDAFKSLDYLRQYALDTLDLSVRTIMTKGDLELKEALREAREIVAGLIAPLYSKVDPLNLGEYSRILAIGREYGIRAMKRIPYFSNAQEKIEEILEKLIFGYPSHGFFIDYEEAKDLGLNVKLFSEKEESIIDRLLPFLDQENNELVGLLPKTKEGAPPTANESEPVPLTK